MGNTTERHERLAPFDEMPFIEHIEGVIDDSESSELEFKSAGGGFPMSFWDTYSAFANTQGGIIVLGVKEKQGRFFVDGLTKEQLSRYKKEFWDKANNRQFVSANLLKNSDIREDEYEGVRMLIFNIPRAERQQIPVHLKGNPFGNTFKRNHEGDYKCTDAEVKRMIADSDDVHPQDSRILENFTMDDIDRDSLRQYRQMFSSLKPSHAWLSLDDIHLLEKLGGYRKNRRTQQEGFTVAGLLMFGKIDSIQDVECVPQYFPDYREYVGANQDVRWTNRLCPDGTWEANLFQFYLKVLPKLEASLPKPFRLENGIRKDETPTHVALREAFINALVHTDYTILSNIVIEHHKNKFVFSNPGTLLISKNQYYKGGESVCRNISLQKMFMMIGGAEKAGSGADKIISGWKDANLAHPYIEEVSRPDKVVLELPLVNLLSAETIQELKRVYGENIESIGKNKLLTLATCCAEGKVAHDRLRLLLNLHRADITRLLQDLCKSGYLISFGAGRGTYYKINERFAEKISDNGVSNGVSNGASNGVGNGMSNGASNGVSNDVNINETDNNGTSNGTSNGVSNDASNGVSNGASSRERITQTRLSNYELQRLILEVCVDWLSIEEMAGRVKKSVPHLKKIVPEMLKKGLLERKFPNTPNHPHQRYKSK